MYGKLFEQMYDGTLATHGPWEALVTFQQLIILADRNGNVDMTPEAISRRTTIPLVVIKKGLAALEKTDVDSRTPDENGRRIIRLSDTRTWGWRIVNHAKYRAIRSQQERRDYMRLYQQKRRESKPTVNHVVNKSTRGKQCNPCSKQYAVCIESGTSQHIPRTARTKSEATACPRDFEVNQPMSEWAIAEGVPSDRVMAETEKFMDFHRSKGNRFKDWQSAWRNWMRKSVEFQERH